MDIAHLRSKIVGAQNLSNAVWADSAYSDSSASDTLKGIMIVGVRYQKYGNNSAPISASVKRAYAGQERNFTSIGRFQVDDIVINPAYGTSGYWLEIFYLNSDSSNYGADLTNEFGGITVTTSGWEASEWGAIDVWESIYNGSALIENIVGVKKDPDAVALAVTISSDDNYAACFVRGYTTVVNGAGTDTTERENITFGSQTASTYDTNAAVDPSSFTLNITSDEGGVTSAVGFAITPSTTEPPASTMLFF